MTEIRQLAGQGGAGDLRRWCRRIRSLIDFPDPAGLIIHLYDLEWGADGLA
jgi:hypothetical protein